EAVATSQADREAERRGPALSAAFDDGGAPTKAAEGFARSCGMEVEHLERLETDKGSWLVFRSTEVGQPTTSLLADIVENTLSALPIAKRMRWGSGDAEFARPVHWVVLMLGDDYVETEILGVATGQQTFGHRFHCQQPLSIPEPADYAALLYGSGNVIPGFSDRQEMIRSQVEELAAELGGQAVIQEELLEEVTALVEWPVPVAGSFEERFLELPDQVLVATMRGHQRYFHVVDADGKLMPHFITVSNIESSNPDAVREGNERVLRPRLSDAAFFFENDLKTPLEDRLETLKGIVFQEKLGSMHDRSQRIAKLAAHVAIALGESPSDVDTARRAGQLCKCDLVSDMVGEFPELQGFMGQEFAARGGESEAVAVALNEAYMPRFAGDQVPASDSGRAVAIADKLDTLVGIFGSGQIPTGDKDPFALRRAALGALRIMIESELDLDLEKVLQAAAEGYGDTVDGSAVTAQVFDFTMDRLRAYFVERGVTPEIFAAVLARRPTKPFDFAARINAVDSFCKLPEAASLAAANKRIQNILRKVEDAIPLKADDELFKEDAEWNLAAKLVGLSPRVNTMLDQRDYSGALTALAGLRESVDAFFDTVMVMDEDPAVRDNRLALLNQISELFLRTADISQLPSQS
ncbi:MAG: glycine--tRNA ligase subunit beta, partial [Gammaproteobacteria bacterium]